MHSLRGEGRAGALSSGQPQLDQGLHVVPSASDMWRPYLVEVVAKRLSQALNILDRSYLVAKLAGACSSDR